jgi:hypothetical protein
MRSTHSGHGAPNALVDQGLCFQSSGPLALMSAGYANLWEQWIGEPSDASPGRAIFYPGHCGWDGRYFVGC